MDFKAEDAILSVFLKSLGPWRESIIIGGGYALLIYRLYFSDESISCDPVGTRDIDSLIPRKIPKLSEKNIAQFLIEAGFELHFKNVEVPPSESYIKNYNKQEIEIEFLTDNDTRQSKDKNVEIAGVVAHH